MLMTSRASTKNYFMSYISSLNVTIRLLSAKGKKTFSCCRLYYNDVFLIIYNKKLFKSYLTIYTLFDKNNVPILSFAHNTHEARVLHILLVLSVMLVA